MIKQLLEMDITQLGSIALSALLIYLALIIFSRIAGPRSFAQMATFDFSVTIALGAIIGTTATGGTSVLSGVTGLGILFLARRLVANGRRFGLAKVLDNQPLMLMDGPDILPEYLERANITEEDLLQSLRKEGITHLRQVRNVVMERDGSISVLKSDSEFDPYLLKGVKGYPPEDQNMKDLHSGGG